MSAPFVAAGALVVALVGWDIALTLLHPSARGPLSYRANRGVWRVFRAVRNERVLTFAGPAAMAVNVLSWIFGLWIGFALAYLPFIDDFAVSPDVPFGALGAAEALYVSGVALTTVGYGDVVASHDALRMALIFQSAGGLGAFTAAITYVLSVYPLITELRAAALRVADLGLCEPGRAAEVAVDGGPTELAHLARDLIESHEHLKRFQILYYFESTDERESLGTLLRGASVMVLALRWGAAVERVPLGGVYGPALEASLRRVLDDLERDFIGGRRHLPERPESLDAGEAERRLRVLREGVAARRADLARAGGGAPEEFAAFVARTEGVLRAFSRDHRHEERALLAKGRPAGARTG